MLRELKDNYRKAKAELSGKAVSRARLVLTGIGAGLEIVKGKGSLIAVPIRGAFVRMMDGDPMQYYTDGSLRHAFGKPNKRERRRRIDALRAKRVAAA